MAQSNAIPAPRVLAVVRDGTDAVPVAGPATEPLVPVLSTEAVPVPAGGVPMTVPERAQLAVAHWAGTASRGAGQLWLHPGRVLYVLWHGKPESMAEHRAYVKSRAWVPPELSGKWAAVITAAGIAFHLLIGRPLKIVSRITDVASERPLRFVLLAALVSALYLILLHL